MSFDNENKYESSLTWGSKRAQYAFKEDINPSHSSAIDDGAMKLTMCAASSSSGNHRLASG